MFVYLLLRPCGLYVPLLLSGCSALAERVMRPDRPNMRPDGLSSYSVPGDRSIRTLRDGCALLVDPPIPVTDGNPNGTASRTLRATPWTSAVPLLMRPDWPNIPPLLGGYSALAERVMRPDWPYEARELATRTKKLPFFFALPTRPRALLRVIL